MGKHLLLRLEAPLMSFGAVAPDARRPVQRWPALSMLTGLLANAMGWRRQEGARLEALQDRLQWAALLVREGERLVDMQTAMLGQGDEGWTSRGEPEGRRGQPATFESPEMKLVEYQADACVLVAIGLSPGGEGPGIDELGDAVRQPARPLFIGRKACVPATPMFAGWQEADDALSALELAYGPLGKGKAVFYGPVDLGRLHVRHLASDKRRFRNGLHAGVSTVYELGAEQWQGARR